MIILICGTSSSGKSSVCQELHKRLGDNWLNFSTDGYLGMLGDKFINLHPDNPEACVPDDICYAEKYSNGTYKIMPGKLCSKLYSTIPKFLDLLAKQRFNIIVDSFISTMDDLINYKNVLSKYNLKFVYLSVSEATIIKREDARKDRLKGSAIHWLKQFDFQGDCDLIIETEKMNVDNICDYILNELIEINL
jgi:chloramphenicol 3-O-phosphotransferase